MNNLDLDTYNLAIGPLRDQLHSLQESESLFSKEGNVEILNDVAGAFFFTTFFILSMSLRFSIFVG